MNRKLFLGIHLVSAFLASCTYLTNNILSLYPGAIAILICHLLQCMFNVGEKTSVMCVCVYIYLEIISTLHMYEQVLLLQHHLSVDSALHAIL